MKRYTFLAVLTIFCCICGITGIHVPLAAGTTSSCFPATCSGVEHQAVCEERCDCVWNGDKCEKEQKHVDAKVDKNVDATVDKNVDAYTKVDRTDKEGLFITKFVTSSRMLAESKKTPARVEQFRGILAANLKFIKCMFLHGYAERHAVMPNLKHVIMTPFAEVSELLAKELTLPENVVIVTKDDEKASLAALCPEKDCSKILTFRIDPDDHVDTSYLVDVVENAQRNHVYYPQTLHRYFIDEDMVAERTDRERQDSSIGLAVAPNDHGANALSQIHDQYFHISGLKIENRPGNCYYTYHNDNWSSNGGDKYAEKVEVCINYGYCKDKKPMVLQHSCKEAENQPDGAVVDELLELYKQHFEKEHVDDKIAADLYQGKLDPEPRLS